MVLENRVQRRKLYSKQEDKKMEENCITEISIIFFLRQILLGWPNQE
jgi:hypothetical protein